MAKEFTIELDDAQYQQLQKKLEGLTKIEQDAAVTGALREGMKVITSQGKTNLTTRNNKKTGNLLKSIGVSVRKKKGASYGGFKRGKNGGNHAHLVDRGTEKRWTKKGYYRGSVSRGNPKKGTKFWTDAVEQQGPRAAERLLDAVYDALNKLTK